MAIKFPAHQLKGLMVTSALRELVASVIGVDSCTKLMSTVRVAEALTSARGAERGVIAQALNILLFHRLVAEVPEATRFVDETSEPIQLDHGAVRTVDGATGRLPRGYLAIAGILEPLGFEQSGEYPLDRIYMTGRSFTHVDGPDEIGQFFVSELHTDRLPVAARDAAARVFGKSRDPLTPRVAALLDALDRAGHLDIMEAAELLRGLLGCFARQHDTPRLSDYLLLSEHSAELAWIATEGNTFNHATARVDGVEALAEQLKQRGFNMKDKIEVSRDGSVRQTAIHAALVDREFIDGGVKTTRRVPGSFFEFITRDVVATADGLKLDLRFDSSNAQGIFKMTAGDRRAAA